MVAPIESSNSSGAATYLVQSGLRHNGDVRMHFGNRSKYDSRTRNTGGHA